MNLAVTTERVHSLMENFLPSNDSNASGQSSPLLDQNMYSGDEDGTGSEKNGRMSPSYDGRLGGHHGSEPTKKRRKQSNPVRYHTTPSYSSPPPLTSLVDLEEGEEVVPAAVVQAERTRSVISSAAVEEALNLGKKSRNHHHFIVNNNNISNNNHHNNNNGESDDERTVVSFQCHHCNCGFPSENRLRLHVEEEHVQKLLEEQLLHQQQQLQHSHSKSTSLDDGGGGGNSNESPRDFSLSKPLIETSLASTMGAASLMQSSLDMKKVSSAASGSSNNHNHGGSSLFGSPATSLANAITGASTDQKDYKQHHSGSAQHAFHFPSLSPLIPYSTSSGVIGSGGNVDSKSPGGLPLPLSMFSGPMAPFLFPVMPQGQTPPISNGGSSMSGGAAGMTPSGVRIFNPEAYCELCNKEFCNKYFLKTHKANKHGIYSVDSLVSSPYAGAFFGASLGSNVPIPPALLGPPPTSTSAAAAAASVAAEMAASMPRQGVLNLESYCEICQKEFCNKYFLKKHKYKIHGIGEPSQNSSTSPTSTPNTTSMAMSLFSTASQGSSSITGVTTVNTSALSADRIKSGSPSPLLSSGHHSHHQPHHSHHPSVSQHSVDSVPTSVFQEHHHQSVPCDVCKIEFPNTFSLQNHKILAHGVSVTESGMLVPFTSMTSVGGSGSLLPSLVSSSVGAAENRVSSSSAVSQPAISVGSEGSLSAFTPEKLREMGVINADAFCDICCKEFCNKYFLRTHKANKHGIGTPEASNKSNSGSVSGEKMEESNSSLKSLEEMGQVGHDTHWRLQQELEHMSSAAMMSHGGGGEINCDVCNRPFSSPYLLKMHKFYTHNIPYIKEENKSKPGSPVDPQGLGGAGGGPGGVSLGEGAKDFKDFDPRSSSQTPNQERASLLEDSANQDLQKLQSMIRELNASVSFDNICRTPCTICMAEFDNKYFLRAHMMNEHGILPTEDGRAPGSSSSDHLPVSYSMADTTGGEIAKSSSATSPDSEAFCEICQKEFCSKYFLKTHKQNIHGAPLDPLPPLIRKPTMSLVPIVPENIGLKAKSPSNLPPPLPLPPPPLAIMSSGAPEVPLTPLSPISGADTTSYSTESKRDRERNVTGRNYCNICNKELCNKYFMKTHMLKMHGINLESQPGEPTKSSAIGSIGTIGGVTCDICQKELCSKYFLKVHKQNTHGISEDPSPLRDPPTLVSSSIEKEPLLLPGEVPDSTNRYYSHYTEVCPLCDRRFKSIKWLKSHMLNDHGDVLKDNLFAHLESLQDSSMICIICANTFSDKPSLQLHLIKDHRISTEELGILNSVGLKNSSDPLSLVVRDQRAKTPVNGSCPSPASAAATSALLMPPFPHQVKIIKRPGGGSTRIYHCSYCVYSTRWLSNLYAHEKRHTGINVEGEKRFVCRVCHRGYRYNHSLQRHMLGHRAGLRDKAGASATARLSRSESVNDDDQRGMVTGEEGRLFQALKMKRYRCSKCNKKFRTRELCLAHIHAVHRKGGLLGGGGLGVSQVKNVRPYRCRLCSFFTRSWNVLKIHINKQHPDTLMEPPFRDEQQRIAIRQMEEEDDEEEEEELEDEGPEDMSLRPFSEQPLFANNAAQDLSKNSTLPDESRRSPSPPTSSSLVRSPSNTPQLPMTYAMPQNPPTAGSFIMQPFLIAQPSSPTTTTAEGETGPAKRDTFVPSLVYLPVCQKISQPMTVAFTLTPA